MFNFKKLKLGQKFTLLLILVFLGGILASGLALATLLNRSAQAQLTNEALMLMEAMNAVRTYTVDQVGPELEGRLEVEFLPETVPAYSANQVFQTFRENPAYEQFAYREATLNPTNLDDKADEFEATLVNYFREKPDEVELHGIRRRFPLDDQFYIARPIQIKQESCLECHSTPEAAPASMIQLYGPNNGFGWQLNEIVGAQIIAVPASQVFRTALKSLLVILGIFILVFALAIYLVNFWLSRFVVRPLNRMSEVAEVVSMGDTAAEFTTNSEDEVGKLAESFNRMRMSLQMAMNRLERYRGSRGNSKDFTSQ
jgi:HAMP domain-containing protein